jgi:hypothetical protein
MICPIYKAAILANPQIKNPIEYIENTGEANCDRERCGFDLNDTGCSFPQIAGEIQRINLLASKLSATFGGGE